MHAIVSGKVQGVFYRESTKQKALELQLVGWVKNLNNGDVELMASGQPEACQALQTWLWEGPPAAKVTQVTVTHLSYQSFEHFEVRR